MNNDLFINYIFEEEKEYVSDIHDNSGNVSNISSYEVKMIVKDILEEVDVTGEWVEIYLNAIKSGHIIYLNELDDVLLNKLKSGLEMFNIDNTCMYLGNKDRYLFLNCHGNLNDIVLTIHEIIHYINGVYDNVNDVNPIIREFPSIFYEMYAIKYLSKLGYSNSDIENVYYMRKNIIFNMIKEIEVNTNDDMLLSCYSYVIGHYLARIAIDKIDSDKLLLSIIKYITEHLSKIDINDIFDLLEVDTKKRTLK